MNECVEREPMIEELRAWLSSTHPGSEEEANVFNFLRAVKATPSADVVSGSNFRDCRNELCLKCGEYKRKHLGACDGCRWEES